MTTCPDGNVLIQVLQVVHSNLPREAGASVKVVVVVVVVVGNC